MRKDVQQLRDALLHELLSTYSDPRSEGALTDFVAALGEFAGAPKLGDTATRSLGSRKPGDPDIIKAVLGELGEASPAQMIEAALKKDSRIKPASFRATYIRMVTDGTLTRKKDPHVKGGYVYRLKDAGGSQARKQ